MKRKITKQIVDFFAPPLMKYYLRPSKEIGIHMTGTGTESSCETGSKSYKKNGRLQRGRVIGESFRGKQKMFWKEVNQVRKGEQARDKTVKDVNGQIV